MRSRMRRSVTSEIFLAWAGESSRSKTMTPRPALQGLGLELGQLALAEDEAGIQLPHPLADRAGHAEPGRVGQGGKLFQRGLLQAFGQLAHVHQERPLAAGNVGGPGLGPGQLLLQGLGLGAKVELRQVPAHGRQNLPLAAFGIGRQEVGGVQRARLTIRHGQSRHSVQAQKKHVQEVFLAEGLLAEVGVQEAHAPQAPAAGAHAPQVRDEDAAWLADDDQARPALAVDEQADLAADGRGQSGQLPGLLRGVATGRRIAPLAQALQGLDLAGLQAFEVAFDRSGDIRPRGFSGNRQSWRRRPRRGQRSRPRAAGARRGRR